MFTLETYLTGHELRMRELPGLASGSVRLDRVHFIFDSAWDGLTKVALFWGADSDTPLGVAVDAEGYAIVPWEVLEEKSIIRFGVYGTGTDTRLTSTLIRYKVQQGAWSEEIGNSGDPTPTMIEQFEVAAQAAIDAAQAVADQAKQIADNVTGNLAADYSDQDTYALGAFCILNGVLYRCTTPITTPEAWNASHWAVASVGDELVAMNDNDAALSEDIKRVQSGLSSHEYAAMAYSMQNDARVTQIETEARNTTVSLAKTQSMFAVVEQTTRATQPHAVGDLLVYGSTLYIVTSPIATGETIAPGTNCQTTSVDANLLRLDATLSITGKAADAKVTGDGINDLKTAMETLTTVMNRLIADITTYQFTALTENMRFRAEINA